MRPNPAAFKKLDTELPLALLPVRMEVRFTEDVEMRVRVYPDTIHLDAHQKLLTAREQKTGHAYWRAAWRSGNDLDRLHQARDWIASQLGSHRALWVAKQTEPTNPEQAPKQPVAAGGPLQPPPQFPKLKLRKQSSPGVARFLPEQWVLQGWDRMGDPVGPWWGEPIPKNLNMSPALVDIAVDEIDDFFHGQGLGWMIDFDAAVKAGMAFRVPWAELGPRIPQTGFWKMVVLGVRGSEEPEEDLTGLLSAHRYTHGFELLAQGTATNNTSQVQAGYTRDGDVQQLFDAEFATRKVRRPSLRQPADLYRATAANSASVSLGITGENPLDLAGGAGDRYGDRARAMNQALWPATFGYYLTSPLTGDGTGAYVSGDNIAWMRDWCADWVRGGATLPTVRCGPQPYGLLPITHLEQHTELSTSREYLENSLYYLMGSWRGGVANVPRFDVDASDAPDDPGEDAADVARILGAVPHPIDFRLRRADDHTEEDGARYGFLIFMVGLLCGLVPDADGDYYDDLDANPYYAEFTDKEEKIGGTYGLVSQISACEQLSGFCRGVSGTPEQEAAGAAIADLIDDSVLPLLHVHESRSDGWTQVNVLVPIKNALGVEGLLRLLATSYVPSTEVEPVGTIVADDITDTVSVVDVLDEAIVGTESFIAGTRPEYDLATPRSLFHQLLLQSISVMGAGAAEGVLNGLQVLRGILDDPSVPYPVEELERLVRETLGLATHRLDAWRTSLAAQRLAAKRKTRAAGLQVGGYGWLVDVIPSHEPQSQGFIHAPTMGHAATAAVLRSGWNAFSTDQEMAPLAVNLSSERIRAARFILDAIRSGQELGEVLGARFERRLHDNHLDHLINDVRRAALDAAGQAQRPTTAIVDGLLLARSQDPSVAAGSPPALLAIELAGLATELAPHVAATAGDLDAVADSLMAQSVHDLLRGNLSGAGTVLGLGGSGDVPTPPLRVGNVERNAQLITHNVITLFPDEASLWSVDNPLSIATPRLDRWASALLGDPRRIVFSADGKPKRLSDLQLGALEFVYLCSPRPTQQESPLGAVIAAQVTGEIDLSRNESGKAGSLSVDELGLVATSIRQLIGRSRPLQPADLLAAGDPAPAPLPPDEIEDRRHDLDQYLRQLVTDIDSSPEAALKLVALNLPGAAGATADDQAAVIARLESRLVEAAAGDDPAAALHTLIGRKLPLALRFLPGNGDDLADSIGKQPLQRAIAADAPAWVEQIGRVRTGMAALADTAELVDMTHAKPAIAYSGVQLPVGEAKWAARTRPEDGKPRTCITAVGPAPMPENGARAGLYVEGWVDAIPKPQQTTGIAVHFDAPTARAPQAVLLSVVADDRGFSLNEVTQQILDTLEMAQVRAVAPEHLPDVGQFLPAIYLPDETVVVGEES